MLIQVFEAIAIWIGVYFIVMHEIKKEKIVML